MSWVIAIILLMGLLLIFLEVFFIPGTSLLGIVGGVAMAAAIIMVYAYYGSGVGNVLLALSAVSVLMVVFAGFKMVQQNTFAMKAEIKGRVNEAEPVLPEVGTTGTALTELRPNGKAILGNLKTEVYSSGEYIGRGTQITVISIEKNKVIVETFKS